MFDRTIEEWPEQERERKKLQPHLNKFVDLEKKNMIHKYQILLFRAKMMMMERLTFSRCPQLMNWTIQIECGHDNETAFNKKKKKTTTHRLRLENTWLHYVLLIASKIMFE